MPDVALILGTVVALMLLPALIFAGIAWSRVRWLRISQHWELTSGRVVKTEITSRPSNRGRRHYHPHITYEFEANGRTHTGDRLHFGGSFNSANHERVETFLKQYPLEMRVNVYYDPANPAQNVIERATPNTRTYWIAAAAWVFFAALFALMSVWVSLLFEN